MTTTPTPASAEPTEAAIVAQLNTFDPVADVPSPVEVIGDVRISAQPTLKMLNAELREKAEALLANTDRSPAAEERAVLSVLRDNSRELRIRAGAGKGATETQRVMLQQANEMRLLGAEYERIKADLERVADYRSDVDENGRPTPVPVYAINGDRRRAMEARLAELGHQMGLIAGPIGERAVKEANEADLRRIEEARQQVADFHEVRRLAAEIVRQERIQRMAEAHAKSLRSTID